MIADRNWPVSRKNLLRRLLLAGPVIVEMAAIDGWDCRRGYGWAASAAAIAAVGLSNQVYMIATTVLRYTYRPAVLVALGRCWGYRGCQ